LTAPKRQEARSAWLRSWAPFIALWLSPVLAFALLVPLALRTEDGSTEVAAPESTVVGERVRDLRLSAVAEIVYEPNDAILSTASGTITAVDTAPGTALVTGDRIVEIDAVPILAKVGGLPFYRDLGPGARGPDVRELNTLLTSLGLGALPDSDRFSSASGSAVKRLQTSMGVPTDGLFRSSYFSYLAEGATQVQTVEVSVGQVVAPGDALVGTTRRIRSTSLKPADDTKSFAQFSGAPTVLIAGAETLELSSFVITAQEIPRFQEFLAAGLDAGVLSSSGDTGESISGLLIALKDPLTMGAVPAQALYSSASGQACLFSKKDGSYDVHPVTSDIVRSQEVGVAYVDAQYIGLSIISNPSKLATAVRQQCE
jgi:peptidoglycan hydrolase-like protein with peptidoglycan-binding domain